MAQLIDILTRKQVALLTDGFLVDVTTVLEALVDASHGLKPSLAS